MPSPSRRASSERLLTAAVTLCAVAAGAVVLLVVAFLLRESLPALHASHLASVLGDVWQPDAGAFGLRAMLVGSAMVTGGALVLATPLGVLSALFQRFFAPRPLARWHRRAVQLLAGVPSVVVGLWGLVHVVPLIAAIEQPGASVLAGVIVLALMIVPTIALTADAALDAVPASYLQGAAALGLGRATTALRVALPVAAPGIGAGIVLAAGRAVGETMAVLMVCGNVVQIPLGPFEPVRTVTANIALEMGYATRDHRAALFVSGLALVTVIAVIVLAAGTLRRRTRDA